MRELQCFYYSTSNLQGKQFILKKMNIYIIWFVTLFPVCKKPAALKSEVPMNKLT